MAERITGNTALEGKEKRLLPQLSRYEQSVYVKLREEALKIEKENPALDTSANTRYLSDYLTAGASHRRELDAYRDTAKRNGIVPDAGSIDKLSMDMQQRFIDTYVQKTLPQYGDQGRQANAMLMQAMKPATIPGMVADQFYREDKGGVRWGGIAGGLLGGLFIFMQMGGMGGGPLAFIAAGIAALAGAWLVNKTTDKVGSWMNAKNTQQTSTAPQVTRSPAQTPNTPAKDQKQGKDAPAANDPISAMAEAARQAQREAIPEYIRAPEQPLRTDNLNPGQTPAQPRPANNAQKPAAGSPK